MVRVLASGVYFYRMTNWKFYQYQENDSIEVIILFSGWDLPPSQHFNTVLIGKSAFIVQKIGSE